jgi:hypothetical protein
LCKFSKKCEGLRMLHRLSLYKHDKFQGLFDVSKGIEGIPPCLSSDKGHPLINLIMTPFKDNGHHMILWIDIQKTHTHTHTHTRSWAIIENALGILKQKFKELMKKSNL